MDESVLRCSPSLSLPTFDHVLCSLCGKDLRAHKGRDESRDSCEQTNAGNLWLCAEVQKTPNDTRRWHRRVFASFGLTSSMKLAELVKSSERDRTTEPLEKLVSGFEQILALVRTTNAFKQVRMLQSFRASWVTLYETHGGLVECIDHFSHQVGFGMENPKAFHATGDGMNFANQLPLIGGESRGQSCCFFFLSSHLRSLPGS